MHYGEFDRVPVVHWAGWPETHERWIREGMPGDLDGEREMEYFGAVPYCLWIGVENMCYLMYDARDVYADIVNTLVELTCWG